MNAESLVVVALFAVAIVLVLGLVVMVRGDHNRSQRLMRWRILLQFLAIFAILGTAWWRASH